MVRRLPNVAALAIACAGTAAVAAPVVIWPVDPIIPADSQASALWIENKGDAPITMQVRALGWQQAGGADDYPRQSDVAISPPMAVVQPGQRQLVRIIRRTRAAAPESSYRLLIDELPPPGEDGERGGTSAQVAIQMRYSIPLFAYSTPRENAVPQLSSRVELADGRRYLVVSNSGNGHARLVNLRARAGTGQIPLIAGLVGYVLPGASMRWPLPAEAPVSATFIVNVNGKDLSLAASA